MEKKKVLFLAEELRVGGAESYFYSIENNINRDKYEFYSMAVNGEQYCKLSHPELYKEYSFSCIDRYRKAMNLCVEKGIEVVHVNSLRLAFVAALIKRKYNIKIIYTKHNLTILEKKCYKAYAKFVNKYIDVVNVICATEKKVLLEMGVDPNRIVIIYNGIQIEKYPYKRAVDEKVTTIGILARLSKEKNHILFLKIAKRLHEKNVNTRFLIGGDGPEKENLINEIEKEDMNEYVEMCGYVKASDFLTKVDFSMLVSEREAFPISIIEAMAVGAVVVAKDVGGIKELIDDNVGYLVSGEDPDEYVNVLIDAIGNEIIEYKRISARKKAEEKYTFEQMIQKIESLYLQ